MASKCIYYVEGECEEKLLAALKEEPARLVPGKVKVYNIIQNVIPKSQMISITAGTIVALVFDTDVAMTDKLLENVRLLRKFCGRLCIVYLPQVQNLEDELVRCTDVKSVSELTKSDSVKNFKADFCKMKSKACRGMLDKHKLNIRQLWMSEPPVSFAFVENNADKIKA